MRKGQIGDLSRFIAEKRKELENLVAELREGEITKEKTRKVRQYTASLEEKERQAAEKQDAKERQVRAQALASSGKVVFSPGMDVLCGAHRREGVSFVPTERQMVVAMDP